MNHGSQSKITPGILINLINEHLPNETVGIGRIDIRKNMTLFDVEAGHQDTVVQAFKRTAYKGLVVRPDQGQEKAAKRNLKETTPDRVAAAMAVKSLEKRSDSKADPQSVKI